MSYQIVCDILPEPGQPCPVESVSWEPVVLSMQDFANGLFSMLFNLPSGDNLAICFSVSLYIGIMIGVPELFARVVKSIFDSANI